VHLLTQPWALHDIDDVERFCDRLLADYLRRRGAHLREHDREDAVSYLVATCWELSQTYDRSRNTSFSKHAYTILVKRVTDFYRQRFGRDQTNEPWYRRRYPGTTPADTDTIRSFHQPESLDQCDKLPAAPDRSGLDSLELAVRAITGDPAAMCDPALFNVLADGCRDEARLLNPPSHKVDERAA